MSLHTKKKLHPNRQFKRHAGNFESHPFGVPEDFHGAQGSQGRRRQEMEDFRRETEEFRRVKQEDEFRRVKQQQEQPKRSPGGSRKFRGNSFSLSPSSHSRFRFHKNIF